MFARRGAVWLLGPSLIVLAAPGPGFAGEASAPPALIEMVPAAPPPAARLAPTADVPAWPAARPAPRPAVAPLPVLVSTPAPPVAVPAAPAPLAVSAPAAPEPLPAPAHPAPMPLPASVPAAPIDAAASPAPIAAVSLDTVPGAIEARLADPGNLWPTRLRKPERDAVAAAYRAQGTAPIWIADGTWSPAAGALMAVLARAAEDGLDPADYPAPVMAPGGRKPSVAELAEAELKLSALAVLYARDARGGRIEPSRLSALITPKLDLPGADAVLTALRADPAGAAAAIEAYNPRQPGYVALKRKLAEIRRDRGPVPVARAPGRRDLTTQSIAALDEMPAIRPRPAGPSLDAEIVANMERWRWLPADIGSRYVAVNIPEFRLRLVEDGRVVHETRVITGKTDTPTPVFSGVMEYAIVNPSWYIPPSIMKKEILPGLAADPLYAERRGYEVIRRGNAISVRQPPGERNALGFIKFMFPNQHAVYLHDTPSRNLFSANRRAFSHGCVRVEDPFRLADFVLGSAWSESRLKRLIGRGEKTIFLPQKLPVHLTYFTLTVDEFGEVRSFEDLYGYSRRVRQALSLGA